MKDKEYGKNKNKGENTFSNDRIYLCSGEENTDYKKREEKKKFGLIEEEDDRKPNVSGYMAIIIFVLGYMTDTILFKVIFFALALILGIKSLASGVRQKAISMLAIVLSMIFIAGPLMETIDVIKALSGSESGDISSILFSSDASEGEGTKEDTLTEDGQSVPEESSAEAGPSGDVYETEAETEPETAALSELVSVETYDTPRDIVLIVNNGSESYIYAMFDVIFYDADGNMMSMQETSVGECAPGQRVAGTVLSPRDRDGNLIAYDHYELRKDIEEREVREGYEYYGDQFLIESNIAVDGSVLADIKNPTGLQFDSVSLSCIFYSGDQAVGISNDSSSEFAEEEIFKFYPPYDADFNQLDFDRYEIIINSTRRYL